MRFATGIRKSPIKRPNVSISLQTSTEVGADGCEKKAEEENERMDKQEGKM